MLKIDTLNQLKQLKKDIKASRQLENGVVKGSAYKFGFVTLDSGRDVYLPPDQMERVLPGDRVEVEIVKDAKNKKVAKLERLLESPTQMFCGKYITKGKTHFVEPDINGMTRWLFVPPNKRKNAKMKDLVLCKITQHPYKTGKAQAAVMDVIGTEHDQGIEIRYALQKHGISTDWSEACQSELDTYTEASIETLKAGRKDYTALNFVTIDSAQTQDIDDALYVEKTDKGWLLRVAIADPAVMIKAGSEIDREEMKRACSIYFPGKQISMLPSLLSSDLCSLVEGKERLAKVLAVQISENGEVTGYELERAVIKSHKKMNYEEVSNLLSSDSGDNNNSDDNDGVSALTDSIKLLGELTLLLGERRASDFLTAGDRQEYFFEFGDDGKVAAIKPKVSTPAHKLVEEAMIVANRCIAQELSEKSASSLYISHSGVREDRRELLDKVLQEDVETYQAGDIDNFERFIEIYRELGRQPETYDTQLLISRQLEKSRLSAMPLPHFGMGLMQYTNFTSPLRKAGDLLIHRQLDALMDQSHEQETASSSEIPPSRLEQLEAATQEARSAVFDVEQWFKCQLIAKQSAVTFPARVQRIFSSGFQVRLDENGIEGFISTKDMEEKFSFNQERLTLTSKSHAIKLDAPVEVKLKHIDWSRKQIQFSLV